MSLEKINIDKAIEDYNNGESITSIARAYGVYPITMQRLLIKSGVKLRHDSKKNGQLAVAKR